MPEERKIILAKLLVVEELEDDQEKNDDHVLDVFLTSYEESHKWRPCLEGVTLKSIFVEARGTLEVMICEEKVLQAISDLGGIKPQGWIGASSCSLKNEDWCCGGGKGIQGERLP